jgi:hypothetical protein
MRNIFLLLFLTLLHFKSNAQVQLSNKHFIGFDLTPNINLDVREYSSIDNPNNEYVELGIIVNYGYNLKPNLYLRARLGYTFGNQLRVGTLTEGFPIYFEEAIKFQGYEYSVGIVRFIPLANTNIFLSADANLFSKRKILNSSLMYEVNNTDNFTSDRGAEGAIGVGFQPGFTLKIGNRGLFGISYGNIGIQWYGYYLSYSGTGYSALSRNRNIETLNIGADFTPSTLQLKFFWLLK